MKDAKPNCTSILEQEFAQTEVLILELEDSQLWRHETATCDLVLLAVRHKSRINRWHGSLSTAQVGGRCRHAKRPHCCRWAGHLQGPSISPVSPKLASHQCETVDDSMSCRSLVSYTFPLAILSGFLFHPSSLASVTTSHTLPRSTYLSCLAAPSHS